MPRTRAPCLSMRHGLLDRSDRVRVPGSVPGIDEETVVRAATAAKETCPVSSALAGVDIPLQASLAFAAWRP